MILRTFVLMLMLVGALQGQSKRNEKDDGKELKFATSSTGAFRNLGKSIKQIIDKYCILKNYSEIKIRERPGGSSGNLKSLSRGDVELALFNSHALPNEPSLESVRLLLKLTPQYLHVLVNEDKMPDIKNLDDIMEQDKKFNQLIAIGNDSSGTYNFLKHFFDEKNSMAKIETNFYEQTTNFLDPDNVVGVSFFVDAIPSAYLTKIKFGSTYKMLDAKASVWDSMPRLQEFAHKLKPFVGANIPRNTYKGLDKEIKTIQVYTLLAVHSSVEPELVKEIVEAIMTHPDELYGVNCLGSLVEQY